MNEGEEEDLAPLERPQNGFCVRDKGRDTFAEFRWPSSNGLEDKETFTLKGNRNLVPKLQEAMKDFSTPSSYE
jgi:hypothetical protein